MRASIRSVLFSAPLVLALVLPSAADAQLGGLLKKKLDKATGKEEQQAAVAPPVFDKVTLEITQERIEKLTAAMRAVRNFAEGPTGPAAYQKQVHALDARQAAIYEKQVNNINDWDQKRRDYENCVDSVLMEVGTRKSAQMRTQMMSDPAFMRRTMELGRAMLAAQQKGDTAAMRKIAEELDRMKAPTKADSTEAAKHCVYPTPSPLIKEWLGLKEQSDSFGKLKVEADAQLEKTQETVSGMNLKQGAVFCERIHQFVRQLKEKKQHVGFSDDEVKRLANLEQAIKDLEALCP